MALLLLAGGDGDDLPRDAVSTKLSHTGFLVLMLHDQQCACQALAALDSIDLSAFEAFSPPLCKPSFLSSLVTSLAPLFLTALSQSSGLGLGFLNLPTSPTVLWMWL